MGVPSEREGEGEGAGEGEGEGAGEREGEGCTAGVEERAGGGGSTAGVEERAGGGGGGGGGQHNPLRCGGEGWGGPHGPLRCGGEGWGGKAPGRALRRCPASCSVSTHVVRWCRPCGTETELTVTLSDCPSPVHRPQVTADSSSVTRQQQNGLRHEHVY